MSIDPRGQMADPAYYTSPNNWNSIDTSMVNWGGVGKKSKSSQNSAGGPGSSQKWYGGPQGQTALPTKKYKKYAESQRNKLNVQQKTLGNAQNAMLPRIQAGPGNAFSKQDMAGMHAMGLQQLQSEDQQRNIGIANSAAARGAGGPDLGALTAAGNRDANRGALAQGDLNAKVAGLNLGLGQYGAFNSAFGNVGSQQASARDAYGNFLQNERPEQQVNPYGMASFQNQMQLQNQQRQMQMGQQFGGGGGGYTTAGPNSYGQLGGDMTLGSTQRAQTFDAMQNAQRAQMQAARR